MDRGLISLAKSSTPSRMAENFAIWDFKLSWEDIDQINALDTSRNLYLQY
ncbi:hypothetical protein ACVRWB_04550 [Streptococcus troglodytae]|nr:hypothetical protein [Streptococcus troglodytae]